MEFTEEGIRIKLLHADAFRVGERLHRVVFLLPESMWRPLDAPWWRGKEVCIIGGDTSGNYLLRHSDGSVRLWEHARASDQVVAPSVRTFWRGLVPSES